MTIMPEKFREKSALTREKAKSVSTTNACKLCKPLGACLAFRGIEKTVPYLHGSQGCATYMRRYIISHFNEPIDIASSSLGEKHAIYGGSANLKQGLNNVISKYNPEIVGIATTCLTETIGDDVRMILHEYTQEENKRNRQLPELISVSTPSYSGTHMEGFHAALHSVVKHLAGNTIKTGRINLLPGFISAADTRLLKDIFAEWNIPVTILPDLSETLDGQALVEYQLIPDGGTKISDIRKMGGSRVSVEFGRTLAGFQTAGTYLADTFGLKNIRLGTPIGIRETDTFFEILAAECNTAIPEKEKAARGRLIDSLVDGHKYVFGKKAVVYGEEDLVVGLTSFLAEIGVHPVLCASGGNSGRLRQAISEVTAGVLDYEPAVHDNTDFFEIAEMAKSLEPDMIVGHSKGYPLARSLDIPLIRVGFPIHDRLGGQRLLHLGYEGAQILFDTVANAMTCAKQEKSPVGYAYM